MKIVDITDIEDVVLAKYEIDKNNPECEGRSDLNLFMSKYCSLTDILIKDNQYISFRYIEVFNKKYLFISDKQYKDDITNFLSLIKYDFNNLKEMPTNEIISNTNIYFIHNNKYYKI